MEDSAKKIASILKDWETIFRRPTQGEGTMGTSRWKELRRRDTAFMAFGACIPCSLDCPIRRSH